MPHTVVIGKSQSFASGIDDVQNRIGAELAVTEFVHKTLTCEA